MKNKTKLMLALSILTAGTLAAGATGTFAWFTTNKTATATYNNIKVKGTQGNLGISIDGVTDASATKTDDNTGNASTTATGSFTSDVSSNDGMTFAQPDWSDSANIATGSFYKINNVSENTGYFTQYLINITNKATGDEGKVSLSLQSVSITCTDSTEAANWTRVAVIKNVKANSSKKILEEKSGTKASSSLYQNVIDQDVYKKYVAPQDGAGKMSDEDILKTATVEKTFSNGEVVLDDDFTSGKTLTLGIAVWLEGTMSNGQDAAKEKSINVELIFSAK